jgi:hypothetical protein
MTKRVTVGGDLKIQQESPEKLDSLMKESYLPGSESGIKEPAYSNKGG